MLNFLSVLHCADLWDTESQSVLDINRICKMCWFLSWYSLHYWFLLAHSSREHTGFVSWFKTHYPACLFFTQISAFNIFFPFSVINISEKIATSERVQLSALPWVDASEFKENSRQSPVFLHFMIYTLWYTLYDASNHRIDFIGISITSLPLDSIFSHWCNLTVFICRGKEKGIARNYFDTFFFRFLPVVSPSTNGCYKIKRHSENVEH